MYKYKKRFELSLLRSGADEVEEFERAIRMMPPGAEQIVWLADFADTDKSGQSRRQSIWFT